MRTPIKLAIAAAVVIPIAVISWVLRARNIEKEEAFAMYRRFAESYHKDRITDCRSISDGASVKDLIDKREERHNQLASAGMQAFGLPFVTATFQENSVTRNGGEMTFNATMTVRHVIASGLTPKKDIPHTDYTHDVTLRKQGGGWVVVSFSETESEAK
ncbi:MAG: hypothetical protein FD180_1206 [Planctomycetota bacterium]|nr:MAG: hypothetical protein FD180_1206 [Planctomycetota bacterium]